MFYGIAVALMSACASSMPGTEAETAGVERDSTVTLTEPQLQASNISLVQLQTINLPERLTVNGKVDVPPQHVASVSVPLGGFVRSLPVNAGMLVKKGQVLAVLEDMAYLQLQEDYLVSKASLVFAEQEYQRQKALNVSKASSDKGLEKAELEYKTLQVTVQVLEQKLRLLGIAADKLSESTLSARVSLYAPFSGFVAAVHVHSGQFVNPADVLLELIDPSQLLVNLTLFEKDFGNVYLNQAFSVTTNEAPEVRYTGTVRFISGAVSDQGTVQVQGQLDLTGPTSLRPGMFVQAELVGPPREVQAVPEASVVSYEGVDYLFVAQGEYQFARSSVRTGLRKDGLVELRNFAAFQGKPLVEKGAYALLMKMENKAE